MTTTVSFELLDLLELELVLLPELELDLALLALLLLEESLALLEDAFPLDPLPDPEEFSSWEPAPAFLLAATIFPFFSTEAFTFAPSEVTVTVQLT